MSDDPTAIPETSENPSAAADDGDEGTMTELAAKAYEKGRSSAYAEMRRKGELQRDPKPVAHPKAALVDRILSTLDADDGAFATATARQANLLQKLRPNGGQPRPANAPTATGGSAMEMYASVMLAREMRAMQDRDAADAAAAAAAAQPRDVNTLVTIAQTAATQRAGRELTNDERIAVTRDRLKSIKVTPDNRRMQSVKIKPGGR